jgi:hypothetical protein
VTRTEAQQRAAERTAAGVPSKVVKDKDVPGGFSTVALAALRRYAQSAKGRAKNASYRASAKGRAVKAKYESSARGRATIASYAQSSEGKAAMFRANTNRHGRRVRVTGEDLARLREAQDNICPLTGIPLDQIKTPNTDHAWDDWESGADCVRGIIHPKVNPALGRTDAELFDFARRVGAYAARRRRVLTRRRCPMSETYKPH